MAYSDGIGPLNVPNTVILSGRQEDKIINNLPIIDVEGGEGPLPGHFVELYNAAGNVLAWRRHSNATNTPPRFILIEQDMQNLPLTAPYNPGDNAIVHPIYPGMTLWPLIPSGQNITQGDQMQSNGDGRIKEATSIAASAGVAFVQALESQGPVTADTRIRVQVIQ